MSKNEVPRQRCRNAPALSRRQVLAAGSSIAVMLAANAGSAADKVAAITIDNFSFNPAVLEVPLGTAVTWTNRDDIPHTIAEKSLAWRSAVLDTDNTFSRTFDAAGEFHYFCTLHPHMTGTVVVKP